MKISSLKKIPEDFALNPLEKELKNLTKDWNELETDHTLLYFLQDKYLDNFKENMINPSEQERLRIFMCDPPTIDKAVDDLFQQVQEILDIHHKMKKLNVYIFENKYHLNQMYKQIYHLKRECNIHIKGHYSSSRNAIFIPAELNDNTTKIKAVLGHELAHAIVDNHLKKSGSNSLPNATHEIIATYVQNVIEGRAKKIPQTYYEE